MDTKKNKYEVGKQIEATYWTGVYKPEIGGYRQERVDAILEVISPGKARVLDAEMEDASSKRQKYNSTGRQRKEVGKIKIISKLDGVKAVKNKPASKPKASRRD